LQAPEGVPVAVGGRLPRSPRTDPGVRC
jgi:hypothetical protein